MTVGVLLVTHGESGKALITATRETLGKTLPLEAKSLSVESSYEPHAIKLKIKRLCKELASDTILILTDLYGSTPCNVSTTFYRRNQIHIISGVNLAMLIKIMNYHSLGLQQLTEKALEGGRKSVLECRK